MGNGPAGGDVSQEAPYGRQKVVYHINSSDASLLRNALGNIHNHIKAVGRENIEIRVVIHGDGVDLLRILNLDGSLQSRITDLKNQSVGFGVCSNTLRAKQIDYKVELFDVHETDIVPSGVAELAKLQQEGYAYIKP